MNEHHNSHFMDGFILGVFIGALAVFLFGTKRGKNLVKIFQDQGIDGIRNLIDEYNEGLMEEEFDEESKETIEEVKAENNHASKSNHIENETKEKAPRKRFFRRK